MRRILMILVVIAAVLVAGGCGQFGKKYQADDSSSDSSTGRNKVISTERFDDAARKKYGCGEVQDFESEGSQHTTDVDEKVDYKANPPHSGNHYQVPLDWGLYDTEQRDVEWVHNLEHGHIVMLYKGLSEKDKKALYDQARINPYHLLVIPRKKDPKNGVYYQVWTHSLFCKTPNKAALQHMVTEYRDQGPELFTTDMSRSDSDN